MTPATGMHREVPVKVTAWIDEGIASLVAAMNEFEDVATLQSCQGDDESEAYVFFTMKGTAHDLTERVCRWTAALGTDTSFRFRMEWLPGTETPLVQLLLPPSQIETVASRLNAYHSTRPRSQ